jgi:hypothetical protein
LIGWGTGSSTIVCLFILFEELRSAILTRRAGVARFCPALWEYDPRISWGNNGSSIRYNADAFIEKVGFFVSTQRRHHNIGPREGSFSCVVAA